jgi:hypothetical protein
MKQNTYFLDANRYLFDFSTGFKAFTDVDKADGWQQYDTTQDAWYFGVWVNTKHRIVLTYAEGDVIVDRFEDDAELSAELERLEAFYGSPPPAAIVIDDDGSRTDYYDKRPTVEGDKR